jgi:hypothetical protein
LKSIAPENAVKAQQSRRREPNDGFRPLNAIGICSGIAAFDDPSVSGSQKADPAIYLIM